MGNKFVSAAGDNPLLKVVPPADRRGAQMKAPSERAPRGKYAGGVLEQRDENLSRNRYLGEKMIENLGFIVIGFMIAIVEEVIVASLNNKN